MYISLSPVFSEATFFAVRTGDVLSINGRPFDFTQLPEGATLPAEAVGSDHFQGSIERVNGVLHITLRFPHPFDAPYEARFPQPITMTVDGIVPLPYAPTEEIT